MRDPAAHERTVRVADFRLPIGAVTIERLMAMPREDWEHLRTSINIAWQGEERILAKCRLCEGRLYIRAQKVDEGHLPMFRHAKGSPEWCPWYTGATLIPDDARAAQYQGHQETAEHRQLCNMIAELAKQDPRCLEAPVDTYRRPAVHARGRWPDVLLNMEGLAQFAIEVQLSKPFAPEITARHLHYEKEGVAILWVFVSLEEPLPQGFHDVITMQRGNAFLFDDEAYNASIDRKTLILKCYMEDGKGGYRAPQLVALDDLNTSTGRSVFLEDCRSDRLLAESRKIRSIWWKALKAARHDKPGSPFYSASFSLPYEMLRDRHFDLCEWHDHLWEVERENPQQHMAELFAILCSIAHSADDGVHVVYTTRYQGDGALLAMLNSKIGSAAFGAYADLVDYFLQATPLEEILDRSSLQDTFAKARKAHKQIGPQHPVWEAMGCLFPEVLDGLVRSALADLETLPLWARPAQNSVGQHSWSREEA